MAMKRQNGNETAKNHVLVEKPYVHMIFEYMFCMTEGYCADYRSMACSCGAYPLIRRDDKNPTFCHLDNADT